MTALRVGVMLAICAVGAIGIAAQQPVFRASGDTVRVFATVTDRDGRLVTSLMQGDFDVRDDGKTQPITVFDNAPRPIRLILMLDVSGSMSGNLPLLRVAAQQLFARLGAADLARVGTFGNDISLGPAFTRDPGTLLRALPEEVAPEAPTPLWRAVDEAMNGFGTPEDEVRRVILVLSDGKDSGPIGFRARYVSQAEVVDRARREDVMVYGIGMRSRGTRRPAPGLGPGGLQAALMEDRPDPGLALVAELTGGGYTEIDFRQDLGAAFSRVADELHSQYVLGFAPPRRDGKLHDIDVRVTPRGLKPRARRSYMAPKGP
jgi:VWFA-related protein